MKKMGALLFILILTFHIISCSFSLNAFPVMLSPPGSNNAYAFDAAFFEQRMQEEAGVFIARMLINNKKMEDILHHYACLFKKPESLFHSNQVRGTVSQEQKQIKELYAAIDQLADKANDVYWKLKSLLEKQDKKQICSVIMHDWNPLVSALWKMHNRFISIIAAAGVSDDKFFYHSMIAHQLILEQMSMLHECFAVCSINHLFGAQKVINYTHNGRISVNPVFEESGISIVKNASHIALSTSLILRYMIDSVRSAIPQAQKDFVEQGRFEKLLRLKDEKCFKTFERGKV